jgi:hypothetical protein
MFKMTVFWDVVSYNLEESDQHLRGGYCLHNQGARCQKTVIFITCHFENLKSNPIDTVSNITCCVLVVYVVTDLTFFFIQVKENMHLASFIILLVTVAILMFVVSYYMDSVCIQR